MKRQSGQPSPIKEVWLATQDIDPGSIGGTIRQGAKIIVYEGVLNALVSGTWDNLGGGQLPIIGWDHDEDPTFLMDQGLVRYEWPIKFLLLMRSLRRVQTFENNAGLDATTLYDDAVMATTLREFAFEFPSLIDSYWMEPYSHEAARRRAARLYHRLTLQGIWLSEKLSREDA